VVHVCRGIWDWRDFQKSCTICYSSIQTMSKSCSKRALQTWDRIWQEKECVQRHKILQKRGRDVVVKELKVKVGVGQRKREEMLQEFKSAKKQWHRKITPPVGKEMTTDEETDSGHYIWQNSLLGVLEQREDYWWASLLRERPKYVLMKAEQVVRLSQEDESSLKIIKTPNRYTLRRSY
jgi:hypothetical protein